jgi:uncharacterized HhH-GPD family protein
MSGMALHITGDPAADRLLSRDPFALVTGMLLDQRIPMEKAFSGPAVIAERMGLDRFDTSVIAAADPETFIAVMAGPPAVHRFPKSMGERVQALARYLVEHYDGDAEAIWRDADSGSELLARLRKLPGFGEQKAKIFLALLAKRLQVQPPGWQQAAGDYGADGYRSVADVVDADSLQKVRDHKRAMKARG